MNLNREIHEFYTGILKYAGLEEDDNNVITNANKALGEFSDAGKSISLPYFEVLKNPEGRSMFHLLNESYTNPDTKLFNKYKSRLLVEINMKLANLVINFIAVASDIQLQQKVKDSKLIELISSIKEVDPTTVEAFLGIITSSKKVNKEAFILDIVLEKNSTVGDDPYVAVGSIDCILHKEIERSLNSHDRDYKVFGHKVRKKDLISLSEIFSVLLPDSIDTDKYKIGTDVTVFRFLDVLLKTSYTVTSRVNEIVELLVKLEEPSLALEDASFDHSWTSLIETMYSMDKEIRIIPSQIDVSAEPSKLNVDTSKARRAPPPKKEEQSQREAPVYQSPREPEQPRQLSPEDIIKGNIRLQQYQQPVYPQYPGYPQQPIQPDIYTPNWIAMQNYAAQMRQNPSNIPPMNTQPPVPMNPNYPPYQGYPQQVPINQGYPQQVQQPGYYPQQNPQVNINQMGYQSNPYNNQPGIPLNPAFLR